MIVRCDAVLFGRYITEKNVLSSSSEQKRKRSIGKVVVEQSRRIGGWNCGRIDRRYGEGEMLEERTVIGVKFVK